MGYNLHIVSEDYEVHDIEYDEVVDVVSEFEDLELRNEMKMTTPTGETITFSGDYILWKKKEFDVWWAYNEGQISSGYTEDDGIEKLKEVAYKLKAIVIGDEGEEY